jgi:TusA-related sulfurtransferase
LTNNKERLREIEDRKIEIILEIPKVNDDFEKMIRLNSEYVLLDDEYYQLKLEVIKSK